MSAETIKSNETLVDKPVEKPIAVFDSGVGGISVLKHIHALLPNEQLLYVADSKYAPYGNKTALKLPNF